VGEGRESHKPGRSGEGGDISMGIEPGWDVGRNVVSYLFLVTFAASPSP
jgi:hypothetical protein